MNKWLLIGLMALVVVVVLVGAVAGAAALVLTLYPETRVAEALEENLVTRPEPAPRRERLEWVEEEGVLITAVEEDSPAADAGLRRGDIILQVDGREVNTTAQLREIFGDAEPGDTVALSVLRCEEPEEYDVTLGEKRGFRGAYLGVVTLPGRRMQAVEVERVLPRGEFAFGEGALVVEVEEDSAAAAAGLEVGDRILSVDGEEITEDRSLPEVIQEKPVGEEIELLVRRRREELTLEATLGEHPDEEGVPYLGVRVTPGPIGMWVEREFPLDEGEELRGALITEIEEGGPAEEAGLQVHDVITAVDDEPLEEPLKLGEIIRAREPGEKVSLTVRRGDEELALSVTLGSAPDDDSAGYLGIRINALVWRGSHLGDDWPGFEFDFPHLGDEEHPFEFHFPHLEGDLRRLECHLQSEGDGEDRMECHMYSPGDEEGFRFNLPPFDRGDGRFRFHFGPGWLEGLEGLDEIPDLPLPRITRPFQPAGQQV